MLERAVHTSQGPKRKNRISEPSRGIDTPLIMPLKKPRFLCRSHPRYPQLLKATSNVFVAEGQALDDLEDLTHKMTAQTAFSYTSRSGRPGFFYQTGGSNSCHPSPVASSRTWMDPRGRQRKMRKILLSDFSRLTLRLG